MEVQFAKSTLKRLDEDGAFTAGFSPAIVKAFRKMIQLIRAAVDERDLYARPAVRFEKLSGKRGHQHSMRLNDQYRLITELQGRSPSKVVVVMNIEDYH